MRLLIVDDEELTRTGLVASIDWQSLGIDEVLQADDGVHGLEQARLHMPEIILCDVRMPRMDGIAMLERIEHILPDSVPIFMSGYSDKAYLKAAIKLKAVNYIEKPLNPAEVQETILEAVALYNKNVQSRRGETLKSWETASRLAHLLTVPYDSNAEAIDGLSQELSVPADGFFTAFIVKMDVFPNPESASLEDFHQELREFLKRCRLQFIYTDKKRQYIVYFLFGEKEPSSKTLKDAGDFLSRHYGVFGRYSIAGGSPAGGISRAYQSYTQAVILLQSSFFFPENTILLPDGEEEGPVPAPELFSGAPVAAFTEALSSGNREAAEEFLAGLYGDFLENRKLLQNPVKDLYYKLFLCLEDERRHQKITASRTVMSIAEIIDQCFTFPELHQALREQTDVFFEDAANNSQENPTVFLIKNYIGKNYMNDALSVKDISEHVFLSTSYVCTFFKNETGCTLNQYITEYRMEKAKQLLRDGRYKISDISSRVGYTDGNYFGKSFKKYCGLSPSEYREQNLK